MITLLVVVTLSVVLVKPELDPTPRMLVFPGIRTRPQPEMIPLTLITLAFAIAATKAAQVVT